MKYPYIYLTGRGSRRSAKFLCFFVAIGFLLLLAGCELYGKVGGNDTNIQGALPELLKGEWIYIQPGASVPAERYIFEGNTIQYGYGASSEGGAESEFDYKGDICFVSNYSADSGIVIIEYTEPPYYTGHNGNSFFGIYYRNLKRDTVQLANAINPDHSTAPDTATLDEAIEKFTRLKMGNYVDWGVVQSQTRVRK